MTYPIYFELELGRVIPTVLKLSVSRDGLRYLNNILDVLECIDWILPSLRYIPKRGQTRKLINDLSSLDDSRGICIVSFNKNQFDVEYTIDEL